MKIDHDLNVYLIQAQFHGELWSFKVGLGW